MKKLSLLILIFVVAASSAVAQKRYDEIKYPELNDFDKAKVETFKMDNGIEFFIVEDRELPLISINVTVYSGSILEPADKAGLASLTGQVMREGGSINYPADELNLLLENKAASMESYFGFGSAGARMNILAEDVDDLLPVFIDFIQNPLFPEEKIELAKTQTKSGISRRNDDQGSIAGREFRKLIYGEDAVYTQQTEYASINNISREDMVKLHEDAFVGNNMLVGVIGDFDADEIKKKLQDAFGSIAAGQKTNLVYPDVDYTFKPTVNLVDKPDVNQSYVILGHIGGLRSNPDYAALQVMNSVLSNGFAGRLFQVVRTDLGLAYAVGGSYSSNRNYPGQFNLTVMTKSETTAEAIDAIIGEVERMQNEPITDKELNDAKDRFLNSLIFRYDTKREILNEQINIAYNGSDPNEFDKYVEEIKKVSIADVQRVAKKYLQPDNMQILVVGNKQEIGNQLDKYGNVNEIDITIPQPEVAKDETTGDAAAGKEWLNRMANAIVAEGTNFTTLNVKGSQTVMTPQGNISLGTDFTINFAEESLEASIESPQGTIMVNIKDGKGTQALGGQEFPMPPPAVEQQVQTIRYNVINIALNPDNFEAEYLGDEEMDGKSYAKLRINLEEPVTFVLDKETGLPVEKRSSSFNPQMGAQVDVVEQLSEWTEVDGVKYAYKTVTVQNGNVAQESTVTEHSIVE
jgi:predicted Zn-dependent peptidase